MYVHACGAAHGLDAVLIEGQAGFAADQQCVGSKSHNTLVRFNKRLLYLTVFVPAVRLSGPARLESVRAVCGSSCALPAM